MHASGGAPHGAGVFFVESDRLALLRDQNDVTLAPGHADPGKLVMIVQSDGNDAVGSHRAELV